VIEFINGASRKKAKHAGVVMIAQGYSDKPPLAATLTHKG
jgi:hypothetical protein